MVQNSESNESISDPCRIVLRQAGPQGTGTITSTPSNLPTMVQDKRVQPSTYEHKPGLGTGAKAGIIIAIVLGVLFSLALGIHIFVRRKKKMSTKSEMNANNLQDNNTRGPPEQNTVPGMEEDSPGTFMLDGVSRFEADGKSIYKAELPEISSPLTAELSPDQEIIELPADIRFETEKHKQ
jgi:hypothetical protein